MKRKIARFMFIFTFLFGITYGIIYPIVYYRTIDTLEIIVKDKESVLDE